MFSVEKSWGKPDGAEQALLAKHGPHFPLAV